MPAHRSPSRNDGVTTKACPRCGATFVAGGRRRWCSDACRQGGHRLRHQSTPAALELPPPRPRKPGTVYVCPSCQQRYLGEQYCAECSLFCRRLGYGGLCPCCDEPISREELS
jgi:hypothetical protein